MYLVARNNKFYSFLMHCKMLHLYAATCIGLALICGAWFFLGYLPLTSKIIQQQQALVQLHHQQQAWHNARNSFKAVQASLQDLQKQFNTYVGKHSYEYVIHDALSFLTDCALQTNLSMRSCRRSNEYDKKWYKKNEVATELVGNFDAILAFLEKVHANKRLICCKQLDLVKQNGSTFQAQCTFHVSYVNSLA